MTLNKGDFLIKTQRRISDHKKVREDLVYKVIRVNRKTYTLECIGGFMKGSQFKLVKNYCSSRVDVYGVETRWIAICSNAVTDWLKNTGRSTDILKAGC